MKKLNKKKVKWIIREVERSLDNRTDTENN